MVRRVVFGAMEGSDLRGLVGQLVIKGSACIDELWATDLLLASWSGVSMRLSLSILNLSLR